MFLFFSLDTRFATVSPIACIRLIINILRLAKKYANVAKQPYKKKCSSKYFILKKHAAKIVFFLLCKYYF